MSDTFPVNHSDFFSLCSLIDITRSMTKTVLDSRLSELDNENTDVISKTACRLTVYDLQCTLSDLDNILQAALNIAPEGIRGFFSHFDERQNSTVVAHETTHEITRCPF